MTSLYTQTRPVMTQYRPGRWQLSPRQRGVFLSFGFFLPVMLAFVSDLANGIPFLTDMAMLLMSAMCFIVVLVELIRFPERFGIGAIVLFGGVLLWFTYDYFDQWFGRNPNNMFAVVSEPVLARAVFHHVLYVAMLSIGILIPLPKVFSKLFTWVPEPQNPNFYFKIVLVMFFIGVSPYLFNTSNPIISYYNSLTGQLVAWKSGRSGNINFNFGAYWAQAIQVGQVGAVLAAAYAIFLSKSFAHKSICWGIVLLEAVHASWAYARSATIFLFVPIALFFYFKYQTVAAMYLQRFSMRSYVITGTVLFLTLTIAQFQINRRSGPQTQELTLKSMTNIKGNSMFSESLVGFQQIPSELNYFYSHFPGESLIRPIPQLVLDFFIGPIPRAIWKNKPVDPIWLWYNEAFTGLTMQGQSFRGTTIAQGAVGYWYIRGGWIAVIQGGLLFGMFTRLIERTIIANLHRFMVIMLCFSILTFFLRAFRGLHFHDLYPSLIGAVVIYVLIKFSAMFRTP